MWSTDLLSVAFLGGFVPSAVLFVILLFTKKYTTVPDIFGTTLGVLAWCSVFNIIPELTTLGAAVGYYSIDLVYCLQDGDLFFACLSIAIPDLDTSPRVARVEEKIRKQVSLFSGGTTPRRFPEQAEEGAEVEFRVIANDFRG